MDTRLSDQNALIAGVALALAWALMKPPTNPLLDDAKQLLGNVGKLAQKKAPSAKSRLPEKTKKDAQAARSSARPSRDRRPPIN